MVYYYYVLLAILGFLTIMVSKKSSMLRNEIFSIANFQQLTITEGIARPRPAYSLGRTQLAFWTVIISSSFIYTLLPGLGHGTISVPDIDPVNLLLLGIAGSTTAVAKVIDTSQQNSQGKAIPQQDYPSKGFFMDIISDEKGVSIHRLQNVVWTIIVGFIYVASVSEKQVLPGHLVISNQLLGLMGVSASAYLGLKTSENKNAPVSAANVNANTTADGIISNISTETKSLLAQHKQGTL